jgi:hypothetical protein
VREALEEAYRGWSLVAERQVTEDAAAEDRAYAVLANALDAWVEAQIALAADGLIELSRERRLALRECRVQCLKGSRPPPNVI